MMRNLYMHQNLKYLKPIMIGFLRKKENQDHIKEMTSTDYLKIKLKNPTQF